MGIEACGALELFLNNKEYFLKFSAILNPEVAKNTEECLFGEGDLP